MSWQRKSHCNAKLCTPLDLCVRSRSRSRSRSLSFSLSLSLSPSFSLPLSGPRSFPPRFLFGFACFRPLFCSLEYHSPWRLVPLPAQSPLPSPPRPMLVIDLFALSSLGWRSACATEPLQSTYLNGVSHQHAMQDLTSSATLHHPAPREAIGDWILPADPRRSPNVVGRVCACVARTEAARKRCDASCRARGARVASRSVITAFTS